MEKNDLLGSKVYFFTGVSIEIGLVSELIKKANQTELISIIHFDGDGDPLVIKMLKNSLDYSKTRKGLYDNLEKRYIDEALEFEEQTIKELKAKL